jgi:hypothetical protein
MMDEWTLARAGGPSAEAERLRRAALRAEALADEDRDQATAAWPARR